MLSKVPEVTVWFWVIKILCTTVGESFADWINMTLGVGLIPTRSSSPSSSLRFWGGSCASGRYVPFVYWLTVVVVSVTGTLYTDILTDDLGVPLALSTSVSRRFSRSCSACGGRASGRCRSTASSRLPRELFYWLASGHLRPRYRCGRLDSGAHRLGTGHLGAAARRPDRRDRDRLATGRERRAVVLARLHFDPPAGRESR